MSSVRLGREHTFDAATGQATEREQHRRYPNVPEAWPDRASPDHRSALSGGICVPLQTLRRRSGMAAETTDQRDTRCREWGLLPGVWLRRMHVGARVPSPGSFDQVVRDVHWHRQVVEGIPGGSQEVRPPVRQLSFRDREWCVPVASGKHHRSKSRGNTLNHAANKEGEPDQTAGASGVSASRSYLLSPVQR
jgi:hypothetical protein